jgi:replicative DNA helicase
VTVDVDPGTLDGAAPPHDHDAEQAVLGAMMLSEAVADELSEKLTPIDFYRPVNGEIFATIKDLLARGEPTAAISVAHALGDRLARVGGAPYLSACLEKPPSAASGGYYAKIVIELAGRRRLEVAGHEITALARSPEPLAEVRDRAAQKAFDATVDRRETATVRPVSELVVETMQHLRQLAAGEVDSGIPTGLRKLDELTGGLHPGQLWIPAARTGVGKSVITQNIVHNAVRHTSRPGLLFSVEMSVEEMTQRLLSEVANVPLEKIRSGNLNGVEWQLLDDAQTYIANLPLHFVDNVRTVPGIRSAARRFRQRMGDLCVIGVDYLQRLQGLDRRQDRHEEVGGFADALKDLGQDMAVPILAPCQLNRGPENRTGKDANRPKLSDLRESGNLEQTADVVALLFRPDYYDKNSNRAGQADIIVDKNRNGPTGTVTVDARLHVQRFEDRPVYGTPMPDAWQ